jgi:hypothetical protein
MAIQLSRALLMVLADRQCGRRRESYQREGLACGCGLVQEEEIAEFVYLVNSFIAPSVDDFLVAVDRHTHPLIAAWEVVGVSAPPIQSPNSQISYPRPNPPLHSFLVYFDARHQTPISPSFAEGGGSIERILSILDTRKTPVQAAH